MRSDRLLLLTFTGCKSGKEFTTPMRYVKEPTLEGITPVRAALAEVIDVLRTIFAYKAPEERDA